MEERSLKITGANKTFFNKLSNTLNKFLIPTKVGFNNMLISAKRNNLIKAFEHYSETGGTDAAAVHEKKYEEAFTLYLEALDKYVMDSIYKKVKNNSATDFEKEALSRYYGVIALKENEYVEYKFRKQKYLIELDNESVQKSRKDKTIDKYSEFYISKMDWIYKGILKNYSIKLADTTKTYDATKEWVYIKIFNTLEEYIKNILSIKLRKESIEKNEEVKKEYEKYERFLVGKLDQRDQIEKNMILISLSRKIFIHSLPLAVAEQCYKKLLKDARVLVQDSKIAIRRENAYNTLINLIEEYNGKILSTKVYWEDPKEKEEFRILWNEYKNLDKIYGNNEEEYKKRKEILFIKDDLKKIKNEKYDYTRLIKYYKRKLVDYGVMRQISEIVSEGKYTKVKKEKVLI